MSASSAARTRPASRPDRLRSGARPLRVVEGAAPHRSALPMTVVVLVVLLVSIIVPLVINTQMAELSFAIRDQQLRLNELDAEAWSMQTSLQEASSPSALEQAAQELGMVPAGTIGFISLSTGRVEGGQAAQ